MSVFKIFTTQTTTKLSLLPYCPIRHQCRSHWNTSKHLS